MGFYESLSRIDGTEDAYPSAMFVGKSAKMYGTTKTQCEGVIPK
jgi:hypothetical protein